MTSIAHATHASSAGEQPSKQHMASPMKVGFIGLGSMGSAIAASLLKGGNHLSVYNRTAAKADALVKVGATLASTPADAARDADAVFTMLSDDAATQEVVWGEHGLINTLPRGGVHIACSTISVPLSEKLTRAHAEAGQYFIAAPVLGRPEMAAAGKLFVVASGPEAIVERVLPLLDTIGQKVFRVAEMPSASTLTKLIANFLITTVIESLAEATTMAAKCGLPTDKLLEVLTESLFNAPIYKTYGGLIEKQAFSPAGFAMPLGQKDNRLLLQAAETAGVTLPFASVIRDRFVTARAQGWDDLDWSAIALLAQADAGLKKKDAGK